MYTAEYEGINSFLIGACKLLLQEAIVRKTRGETCYELPEPFMFKIKHPTARIVTIAERKWNKTLPYAESLWLASGRNNIDFITHYLPRMIDFSDDEKYMRGGYGPRFRHYNGSILDYAVDFSYETQPFDTDQFKYIADCFKQDMETRRAVISLGEPVKDCFDVNFNLKQTLDVPCTRLLHFMKQANSEKLNLIVGMRSNDILWGASAVNIFNYTFIQEYFSAILGLEIGEYFHIADTLHYYEKEQDKVKKIAQLNEAEDYPYSYFTSFHNLVEFDNLVSELSAEEMKMRILRDKYVYRVFDDDFIQDWYNVLYAFNTKKEIEYINPILNRL